MYIVYGEKLNHTAMVLGKLKLHLSTKHSFLSSKDVSYFSLKSSKEHS